MNKNLSSIHLQDPSFNQVRVRKEQQLHEYVVPSYFPTNPTSLGRVQTRKNVRPSYKKNRFSLPPPTIREEDEMLFSDPVIMQNEQPSKEDDEDIPLAVLAYRKGFKVPVIVDNAFPLIQHVYPNQQKIQPFEYPPYYYYTNPCYNAPASAYHASNNQRPSLYQLNNNSSLSLSPSSSNSSLSSIENMSSISSGSNSRRYCRRQSSHI